MDNREDDSEIVKNVLDTLSPKRGRGRPTRVVASAIKQRADDYRGILRKVSDELWPPLLEAKTEGDVVNAFQNASPNGTEFPRQTALILALVKDTKFPKRREVQINFLADSLASMGEVSPRRSRDICAQERAKVKRANHIVRFEFYVECSCGYEGPSYYHACKECGAVVSNLLTDF
jgi:hypothetical protein